MRKYISIIILIIIITVCIAMIGGSIKFCKSSKNDLVRANSFEEEISVEKNVVSKYSSEHKKDIGKFSTIMMEKLLCEEKNICFSPVSMYNAMTLLAESSKGDSQKEILHILGTDNMVELENNCIQIIESVEKNSHIIETTKTLISNSIWIYNMPLDHEAEEVFENCENQLNTYVYNGNFKSTDINNWVKEKTNGTIKEIVDNNYYDFVIANALYHESKWNSAFTVCGYADFEINADKKVMTQYMDWKNAAGRYIKGDNYTAIPVDAQGVNMIFVCPDEGVNLSSLVCEKTLNEIIASMEYGRNVGLADIELRVPLFGYEYKIDGEKTKNILNSLGIKEIYDNPEWIMGKDDFDKGIVNIVQNTRIMVDENGIQASGATGVSVGFSKQDERIKLMLDKPFMWIIEKDGLPLLVGTVYNPTEG